MNSTEPTPQEARLLATVQSGPTRAALLELTASGEPAFVLSRWAGYRGRSVRSERFRDEDVPHLYEVLDQVEAWASRPPLQRTTKKDSLWKLLPRNEELSIGGFREGSVYVSPDTSTQGRETFRIRRLTGEDGSANWFLASDLDSLRFVLAQIRKL